MKINRHNYETFFLLYIDNELSDADRKAVEIFVEENADLDSEFRLLKETTLTPERISFELKQGLFKQAVEEDALEEKLLYHLDWELDPVTAGEIEALIAHDQQVQQEWNILQQTKLDAGAEIIFQNKRILYRHERDRVISMRIWRIAAAAAILFACIMTGIMLQKRDDSSERSLANDPKAQSAEIKSSGSSIINKHEIASLQSNTAKNALALKNVQLNNDDVRTINKKYTNQIEKKTKPNFQLALKEKNISGNRDLENINKDGSNKIVASAVLNKKIETEVKNKIPVEIANVSMKEKIKAPSVPIIDYNSVEPLQETYARTAVMNDAGNDNNNTILYMNEQRVSRSKIGGIFRKVKRVIERNTNIKTGNGINIAGFEIAVK